MFLDFLPRTFVSVLAAFACFYAPGLGLVGRSTSALPLLFARVLASTVVTTIVATGLAATETFSLPALLGVNAVAAGVGLVARRRRSEDGGELPRAADFIGPAVFAVALALYWPGYPAFLGASDSTAYVATGVSLAHHGTLARDDELGPTVPRDLREGLFDSMSQVLGYTGPPYRRMPGAMMLESLDSTRAWPDFFPVPSVWAAVFVAARAPGGGAAEEAAPGFAPVFGALALWAFWHLASAWLGRGFGLVAVILLGASGPFYSAARMPLSEGIAAYFVLGGLAVMLLAGGAGMRRGDAALSGAALGAAVFTRVETGLLLALAFALLPLVQSVATRGTSRGSAPVWPPAAFFASMLAVSSLVLAEAALVPGTYILPLLDQLRNEWIRYQFRLGHRAIPLLVGMVVAGAAMFVVCARRFGASATLRWGFVASVLTGHALGSTFLAGRTPMWLSFYLGWPGLGLAAIGAVLAWRDGARPTGAAFLLALATATAAIIFYNPHVYPILPWGARRFVPVLFPLLVLMATYAAAQAASRSRLLCLACIGVLAFFVAAGGRPLWGKNLMAGAWDQLDRLSKAIPTGGTILVDRDISSQMVGPALWLVHDRNGLGVPPTGSEAGRLYLPKLVSYFSAKGPVYLVTRGAGDQVPTPFVRMELLARTTSSLVLLEQAYARRPQTLQRYVMPLAVYRLSPDPDPRGGPVK